MAHDLTNPNIYNDLRMIFKSYKGKVNQYERAIKKEGDAHFTYLDSILCLDLSILGSLFTSICEILLNEKNATAFNELFQKRPSAFGALLAMTTNATGYWEKPEGNNGSALQLTPIPNPITEDICKRFCATLRNGLAHYGLRYSQNLSAQESADQFLRFDGGFGFDVNFLPEPTEKKNWRRIILNCAAPYPNQITPAFQPQNLTHYYRAAVIDTDSHNLRGCLYLFVAITLAENGTTTVPDALGYEQPL